MIEAIKNLNLAQKKGMLMTVKQKKINAIRTILSNLRQPALSLCDYSDVFILVAGDTAVAVDTSVNVAFKNFSPISSCKKNS